MKATKNNNTEKNANCVLLCHLPAWCYLARQRYNSLFINTSRITISSKLRRDACFCSLTLTLLSLPSATRADGREGRVDRPSVRLRPASHRGHQLCLAEMGSTGGCLVHNNNNVAGKFWPEMAAVATMVIKIQKYAALMTRMHVWV